MLLHRLLLNNNFQPIVGRVSRSTYQQISRKMMATESKVPAASPPPAPQDNFIKFGRLAIYAYFSTICGYFAINYIYGHDHPSGDDSIIISNSKDSKGAFHFLSFIFIISTFKMSSSQLIMVGSIS